MNKCLSFKNCILAAAVAAIVSYTGHASTVSISGDPTSALSFHFDTEEYSYTPGAGFRLENEGGGNDEFDGRFIPTSDSDTACAAYLQLTILYTLGSRVSEDNADASRPSVSYEYTDLHVWYDFSKRSTLRLVTPGIYNWEVPVPLVMGEEYTIFFDMPFHAEFDSPSWTPVDPEESAYVIFEGGVSARIDDYAIRVVCVPEFGGVGVMWLCAFGTFVGLRRFWTKTPAVS